MQNGSYGEKEKSRETKNKDKIVETEEDKLSRRREVIRILGDKDGLSDEWDKTIEIIKKIAQTVLGVTYGKLKGDRKTW